MEKNEVNKFENQEELKELYVENLYELTEEKSERIKEFYVEKVEKLCESTEEKTEKLKKLSKRKKIIETIGYAFTGGTNATALAFYCEKTTSLRYIFMTCFTISIYSLSLSLFMRNKMKKNCEIIEDAINEIRNNIEVVTDDISDLEEDIEVIIEDVYNLEENSNPKEPECSNNESNMILKR